MMKHTKKQIILLSVILASLVAMKAHASYYTNAYDASNENEEYLTPDEIALFEDTNSEDPNSARLHNEKEKLQALSKDLKISVNEEAELAKELEVAFKGDRSPAITDQDNQFDNHLDDQIENSDSISSQNSGLERNGKNRSR